MDVKRCNWCKQYKPVTEFGRLKRSKDGLNFYCKLCNKDRCAANYRKHKGKYDESSKAWRKANPDKYRELMRRGQKRYRERDPEAARKRDREYYANNKEQERAKVLRWAKNNPEKIRERNLRQKARRLGNAYEKIDPEIVYERDERRCHICEELVPRDQFSLDHLIPSSQGGPHLYLNVATSHLECNIKRGAGKFETHASTFARLLIQMNSL